MANTHLEYHPFKDLESGMNHLAFSVGTKENVVALTKQLEEDGYTVVSQPRTTGDGYYESKVSYYLSYPRL
jgi:lactoylglutathione lyase